MTSSVFDSYGPRAEVAACFRKKRGEATMDSERLREIAGRVSHITAQIDEVASDLQSLAPGERGGGDDCRGRQVDYEALASALVAVAQSYGRLAGDDGFAAGLRDTMRAIERAQRDVAASTATVAVADGRVAVTVNADGVVINHRFADGAADLGFEGIAAACTRAAQQAAIEVRRKAADRMAPIREQAEAGTSGFPDHLLLGLSHSPDGQPADEYAVRDRLW